MRKKMTGHGKRLLFYYCMILLVGFSLAVSCFRRDIEHIFLCILALVLFSVPTILKNRFKLSIPAFLEVMVVAFILCGIVLGEVENFFIKFKYWDTILHTVNGVLCAAISLSLVTLLNKQERILFRLSPVFLFLVAVSFSMMIGVLWEFFEFGMDYFLHMDMQKDTWLNSISTVALDSGKENTITTISPVHKVVVNDGEAVLDGYLDIGLYDTMEDLFVTFVGAVAFNLFAVLYSKKHKGFITCLLIDTDEHIAEMEEQRNGKKDYND